MGVFYSKGMEICGAEMHCDPSDTITFVFYTYLYVFLLCDLDHIAPISSGGRVCSLFEGSLPSSSPSVSFPFTRQQGSTALSGCTIRPRIVPLGVQGVAMRGLIQLCQGCDDQPPPKAACMGSENSRDGDPPEQHASSSTARSCPPGL